MEKERLTEDIKYRIELLRLTSLVSLAVGGGVVGLLAPVLNRVVLASGGIALLTLLVARVVYLDRRIRSAIAALRTMGQNSHRRAKGQSVIASGAKQSLPGNRDCFVTYRSSQ